MSLSGAYRGFLIFGMPVAYCDLEEINMHKEYLSREALSARVRNNREAKSPSVEEKQDRGFRRFSQKPLFLRELGEASAADSLGLYRQMVYKVQGHLNPVALREAVQAAIAQEEILRSSFFVEKGMLCQAVFPEYQMPDMLCWNQSSLGADKMANIITAAMDGDMRQGLGADEIFRLSAYQTAEDTYAVLVTAENILAENFDFRQIWTDSVEERKTLAVSCSEKESKDYWESLLPFPNAKNLLPFGKSGEAGKLKTYRLTLPKILTKELFERTAGQREILTAALATAWTLTLNGDGALALSTVANGKANVCPLLLPGKISTTENLVTAMADQMTKSPLFSFGLAPFPCNCLLSCDDFLTGKEGYVEAAASPAGQLVLERVWSPNSVPLSLYFTYDEDLSVLFLYESDQFKPFGVDLLAKRFLNVLSKLSRDFRQPFLGYATISYQEEKTSLYEPFRSSQRVFDLLHDSSLLREVPISKLQETLGMADLVSKLQGDKISGEALEQNIIYLAQGQVSVSLFDSNGWCNILGIKGDGAWLNESILLPQRTTKLAIEVVSDAADLIYIPISDFRRLLYDEPSAVREMLLLVLAEREKYQKLWVRM